MRNQIPGGMGKGIWVLIMSTEGGWGMAMSKAQLDFPALFLIMSKPHLSTHVPGLKLLGLNLLSPRRSMEGVVLPIHIFQIRVQLKNLFPNFQMLLRGQMEGAG